MEQDAPALCVYGTMSRPEVPTGWDVVRERYIHEGGEHVTTYNLLIVYTDKTEKVIESVNEFSLLPEFGMFRFTKNGHYGFIPAETVRYFGREFDYRNE